MIHSLFDPSYWEAYVLRAARGLLLAIPLAVLFELAGVVARRSALKVLAPALARDHDRDPATRARRRRALRDLTLGGVRWGTNLAAIVVILSVWNLNPLAVAVIAASLLLTGQSWLKDAYAGYGLLLDDCLAPGDHVVLNGELEATVAEVGLRRIRLTDDQGRTWWVRCSEIRTITNHSQTAPAAQGETGR